MMILYSADRRAFFSSEIHAETLPADAVEISDVLHAELMAAQAAGQIIVAGPGGQPVAQDQPPPPPPAPIRVIRSLAFRMRLGDARRAAVTAAAVVAAVTDGGRMLTFLLDQAAGQDTNLDDDRVVVGVGAMLAAGIITEAERDTLLADGTIAEV